MTSLSDLPLPALVALALLVVVQLVLQIVALVSLAREPSARVSLGGRKWLWALVIIVGELVGPIAYLVAGRLPAVSDVPTTRADDRGRRANAVEVLYGSSHPPARTTDAHRPR